MVDRTLLLQRAMDAAEHGIYVTDPEGTIEMVNPGFCNLTGYTHEQLIGERIGILKSGRMSADYYARLWSTIQSAQTWREEIINRRSDGTLYWAFQVITPVADDRQRVQHYVGIQNDISEKRTLQNDRDAALAELDAVFSNTRDALFLIDVEEDGTFRYRKLNPAHETLTGFTTDEVRGKTPQQILPMAIARRLRENYRRCLESGSLVAYEEELDLPAGKRYWHTQLIPVRERGRVIQIVGSARDITERRHMEEELRYLSEMDALTGIANRRKTIEELEREIARAVRHDHPLSVLLLDIDHFKDVNDIFGHETGDSVLRAISSTAKAVLRPSDRLGRWGGEEFVIVLPETGPEGAQTLAGRVLDAVRDARAIPDYPITVSIGIASFRNVPGERDTVDSLVQRADERLYRAKDAGRNQACQADTE